MSAERDEILTRKVQEVLDSDVRTREYGLKADVVDGKARITGIVDTLAEREQVSRIVSAIEGIRAVENGVAISTDGAITDDDVAFEVGEELDAAGINRRHVGVKSVKGVVFLQGRVDSPEEIEAARAAAARARGVKEVVSQLKLRSPGGYDDESLEAIFHHQVNNDREDEGEARIF
ncbi:MAG: hyperosmotically inducible periplasmic protein [Thermoanaerobacter sp.]|uniref:BON domain-containing protein n=1 Tax=Desulfofundulus thermocisternus TaxID=42471 RepID=UPI0004857B6A|nr:BON domain-containing protein [Desulfofundulus thermocisternus]MDK2887900.1 hyperosmotically inducible periplasmic protein [Thermoanaerobacter sp.]